MVKETATFAGGCFWGVEKVFHGLSGVIETTVGYTGGAHDNPCYAEVCKGCTGHYEAVEVQFDPALILFDQLLAVFWELHDPTNPYGQGPDRGTQYLSAIFFHSPQQQAQAQKSLEHQQQSGRHRRPLVTRILPAVRFWTAEPVHQKYFLR